MVCEASQKGKHKNAKVLILVLVEDGLRVVWQTQSQTSLWNVLILVLVEDGLRVPDKHQFYFEIFEKVLILVLVEDGLRVFLNYESDCCYRRVLILVLVEDGLRG